LSQLTVNDEAVESDWKAKMLGFFASPDYLLLSASRAEQRLPQREGERKHQEHPGPKEKFSRISKGRNQTIGTAGYTVYTIFYQKVRHTAQLSFKA
jgi:hypothetical protein